MSYYDHATMMAHKLGPWADDDRIEQAEMRTRLTRVEGAAVLPSIRTMLSKFRSTLSARKAKAESADQVTVLCADGDALRKT
jgi:hypothetical protein